jgi:NTE family protein
MRPGCGRPCNLKPRFRHTERGHRPAVRVGLVLGGGGTVGAAYHAGSLTALEHDLGWDPRQAEVIVGTSAGSLVGALLRVGIPASDLAAHLVEAYDQATHPLVTGGHVTRPSSVPPMDLRRMFLRLPRLPSTALLGGWLRRPWAVSPLSAVISLLPDGTIPLREDLRFFDEAAPGGWTSDPLWVCTTRRSDLHRVVFGREELFTRLGTAVAASCAIPGFLSPVKIGTQTYVDGGVHSPTNADVLRGEDLDLVIIVAPMSAERVTGWGAESAVRRHSFRKIVQERRRLERAGIPTIVIAPGPPVLAHCGLDFMSPARVADIVGAAFLDTGRQLTAEPARALLDELRQRRPQAQEATARTA